ncbi:histidine kinase [Nitrosarchaeum sp.]|uniref:histidine kinase n=1 Tax=Nitrosarchaeum sp. TaxID=2026886 RepID=UPI00247B4518|nr:histidine kinase [Nitrosarchaeum sp.]MCV0411670.1 histidine kinase [Nitrosarchaeum sp.]
MSPEIVPDKLVSSINYKILAIIIGLVLGFHFLVNNTEESDLLVYMFSMSIPASVAIVGFIVARRYTGTLVYAKAYNMLAIAFLFMLFAEFTYFIYEQWLDLEPYPSIADVFFFMFYPMIVIYLIINVRFFAPKLSKLGVLIIISIPLIATSTYLGLTIEDYGSFDFFYGIIFVAASSATLGLAIHAASIFRGGLVGTAWLVLVLGITINLIGDVWYYYIEVIESYSLGHPVNLCWYAAYLLILYALYKHKTSI